MADALGPDQEFDITLGVIPARAQHGQVELRPVDLRIIPIDNRHLCPGLLQSRFERGQILVGRTRSLDGDKSDVRHEGDSGKGAAILPVRTGLLK